MQYSRRERPNTFEIQSRTFLLDIVLTSDTTFFSKHCSTKHWYVYLELPLFPVAFSPIFGVSIYHPHPSLLLFTIPVCIISATAYIFEGVGRPIRTETLSVRSLVESLPPDDVLVKIDVSTICGSDLHTISGLRNEPTPLVLGHEGVGTIVAFGKSYSLFLPLGLPYVSIHESV